MSRDALKSLLDEMLTDAGASFRASQSRGASAAREPEPPPPTDRFSDVEQLRGLSDVEIVAVIKAAARDDVLTVLSGGSDALRRKILTNCTGDLVKWLQQNLEYFDEPTRALLAAGRSKVVAVANRLLDAGTIKLPAPGAEEGAQQVPDEIEQLGGVILELLALVQKKGPRALGDVVSAGGDPLLQEGLARVARGETEASVAAAMDAGKRAMLEAYARRLDVVREGVLALARGDAPEVFRKRLGEL